MKEERKISISDYLKARVNEQVSSIKRDFTSEADLENYRRMVKEKLAAVVLTPGWFQSKDEITFLKLGTALANEGFVAICMDRIENLGATPNSINTFSLAYGSCLEGLSGARIVRALDYLVTREDVDAERIGIAGLCSGSITMWSGVPIEPRFKAIVHVSGTTNQESWSMDFNYAGDMETAFPGILKHGDIQVVYEVNY